MRTLIRLSLIIPFMVMTVFSAKAADPALILYFTFDEQLYGRKVEDMTGNGNNGQLKWGAKITGEPEEVYNGAGALKISGNISAQFRVDSFNKMDRYQDHTYTFWIYLLEGFTQGAEQSILKKNADEGAELGGGFDQSPAIWISENNTSLWYLVGDGGIDGLGPDGEGTAFEVKKWYHIAGVKKAADLIIYINGEEKGRYNVPKNFPQGDGHLRIGGSRDRAAYFAMDDFAIYERSLMAKEVALDARGIFLSVEPRGKLATTWSRIKISY